MKISRILFASFFVFHISLRAEESATTIFRKLPYEVQGFILDYLPYEKVGRLCKANPEDKNANGTAILYAVRRARRYYWDAMYALRPLQHSVSKKINADTIKDFAAFIANPKHPNEQYQKVQTAWEFVHSFNTNRTPQINILDRYKNSPCPKEALLNDINKRSAGKKGARFAENTRDKKSFLVLRTKTKTLDDQSTKKQIDLDLDNMPPEYALFLIYERLKDFPGVPAAIKTDNTEFLTALLRGDLKTISFFSRSLHGDLTESYALELLQHMKPEGERPFRYRAPTERCVLALFQLLKPVVEFDFSAVNTQLADGKNIDITDSFLQKMIEILKVKYPDIQAVKFKGALYGPQNAEEILEIMTPSTMKDPIQFKWTSTNPLKKKHRRDRPQPKRNGAVRTLFAS